MSSNNRVLAEFIGVFKEKDPCWHCIQGRADDDDVTPSVTEMIGLPDETAMSEGDRTSTDHG
jgi:hypothetical protein